MFTLLPFPGLACLLAGLQLCKAMQNEEMAALHDGLAWP